MLWHVLVKGQSLVTYICEDCSRQCIVELLYRPTVCPKNEESKSHKKVEWKLHTKIGFIPCWECLSCNNKCFFHSLIQPTICIGGGVA